METISITGDFKLILNQDILEKAGFFPGQEIQISLKSNLLELSKKKNPKSLKGFLKGIDTKVPREMDRL